MIKEKALRGFLFALLCILAGGFLMIGGGILMAYMQWMGLGFLGWIIDGGLALILLGSPTLYNHPEPRTAQPSSPTVEEKSARLSPQLG